MNRSGRETFAAVLAVCFALAASAVDFTGGVDFECTSAYVFHGMVFDDEPIAAYCPWFELHLTKDCWFYGNFWQLYDLTGRRRVEGIRGEWNETDFEIGGGANLWRTEDGTYRFSALLGWYWETDFEGGRWMNAVNYPVMRLEFANPFVVPFVHVGYEFVNSHSMLCATGLKREFEIVDHLALEAKVSAFGGHKRLMRMTYLSESAKTGIGAVEGRLTLKWQVARFLEIDLFCAVLGNVNSRIQHDWHAAGDDLPDYYTHEQLVYGGITASFGF